MPIQSQSQLPDNQFVVTSVVASTVDPTHNIVTMRALVPASNSNANAVGQAYNLSDSTLTSNKVATPPALGPSPGGSYPVA